MKLRISTTIVAIVLASGLASAQQPKTETPPPKLPAELQKPRSQTQAEFAVAAGDTVLFAYQSKEVTRRTVKILETQAAWLKQHASLPVSLEAYCDDDMPAEQMRQLCLERGNAVKAELVRGGVAADRVKVTAFIDPPVRKGGGATAAGRKEDDKSRRNNRRVMTRVDG